MPTLVIQHPVADYPSWKKVFDSDPIGRAQNGVVSHSVYRANDDPGYVVVHLEFSSIEQAHSFLAVLRELWRGVGDKIGFGDAAGVESRILDPVERVDY